MTDYDEECLILLMLGELHANVPEADRPMSMSDLSDDQTTRARNAVRAITPAVLPNERLREALERAAENFERLQVPHLVGNDVHNFAYQAAKAARSALSHKKDGGDHD